MSRTEDLILCAAFVCFRLNSGCPSLYKLESEHCLFSWNLVAVSNEVKDLAVCKTKNAKANKSVQEYNLFWVHLLHPEQYYSCFVRFLPPSRC